MAVVSSRSKRSPSNEGMAFDEFLDLAGHELRVPITALKGQAQLLQRRLRKQGDRDTELADLDKIIYQIERLNHQLGVLLDTTHIAQKRMQILPTTCDLTSLTQRLVATYNAGSPTRQIHVECADERLVGEWDRLRIESVLGELLANALKYSTDGDIIVRLARDGAQARVEVEDSGVGIPAAERARVFNAYTHASNVENAGVGLGLHVAREAVKKHHGKIGVRARRGGGSIFWFTLPLLAESSGADEATTPTTIGAGRASASLPRRATRIMAKS